MRITVQELKNVIARLPLAHSYEYPLINIAIQGRPVRPGHSDLRVVTFRITKRHGEYSPPEWELVLA